MNNFKSIVLNWGLKLGIIGVLAITMCSVANGQVEIERLKVEREAAKEKARQEAKAQNLPEPSIIDVDLIRPTLTERQGGALFISTPKGFNWFEDIYNKADKLPDWERWQLPTNTNPFVPLSELDIAKEEIGSYLYSQEYEAKFVEFSGACFLYWNSVEYHR